jgi:hypothetical protein
METDMADEKQIKPARQGSRQSMTPEKAKELGLDPAPYGKVK